MKRKSIALLLALMMCLALLSACGANDTPDTVEPPASGDTPTEQQPADGKEEQPSQEPEEEEPKQDEPEESPEPVQEEPKEEEHAGTKLLALLQEEWNNGFVEGEGPKHTYYNNKRAFIHNGVVYIKGIKVYLNGELGYGSSNDYFSYDIASKDFRETSISADVSGSGDISASAVYFMDGNFYFTNNNSTYQTKVCDCNGALLNSSQYFGEYTFFEKGVLVNGTVLLSHSFEKIADIPAPQRDIEHGLKEDVDLGYFKKVAADGTMYLLNRAKDRSESFQLNTDTCEWELGDLPPFSMDNVLTPFCGKYAVKGYHIYDRITGEDVFNCSGAGVYPPVSADQYRGESLCYFGGDKYLGFKNGEYRWVNLKDLTMSDPLPFPKCAVNSSSQMTILNDTYCVYYDDYGWFLWNYNTGEEETILMFDK